MLLDDILAIALAWFLLDEIKELNLTMLFGAGLVLSACFLQAFISFETDKADKNGSFSFSFSFALILWSLGFGFAWGIVDFSFAYYNDQGLIEVEYGFPYYLGALLTSAFILVLNTEDAQKNLPNRFSLGVLIAIAALVNLSCFFLDYATYGLAPVTKVQPVLQFTGLIGPILVGLFIFNEKDALTPSEKRVLILGLTGAALVISS
ncbi:hypothetical protein MRY87_08370 [bacterium]|nr:hypothetical protein [bacterium]